LNLEEKRATFSRHFLKTVRAGDVSLCVCVCVCVCVPPALPPRSTRPDIQDTNRQTRACGMLTQAMPALAASKARAKSGPRARTAHRRQDSPRRLVFVPAAQGCQNLRHRVPVQVPAACIADSAEAKGSRGCACGKRSKERGGEQGALIPMIPGANGPHRGPEQELLQPLLMQLFSTCACGAIPTCASRESEGPCARVHAQWRRLSEGGGRARRTRDVIASTLAHAHASPMPRCGGRRVPTTSVRAFWHPADAREDAQAFRGVFQ